MGNSDSGETVVIFHFWKEISKVILGEQTLEEFIIKFDKAVEEEIKFVLQKRIDELIDLKLLKEEL